MIAEYKGKLFKATGSDNQVNLITHEKFEDFEAQKDYFIKRIDPMDPELTDLYEMHLYVKYIDNVEENKIWKITSYLDGRVELYVDHDAKDSTWTQCGKGEASKLVKLEDCEEFYVTKTYTKMCGARVCVSIKFNVGLEEFKELYNLEEKL